MDLNESESLLLTGLIFFKFKFNYSVIILAWNLEILNEKGDCILKYFSIITDN